MVRRQLLLRVRNNGVTRARVARGVARRMAVVLLVVTRRAMRRGRRAMRRGMRRGREARSGWCAAGTY